MKRLYFDSAWQHHSVAKGAGSSGLLLVVGKQPVKTQRFHGGEVKPIRRAAVDGRSEDLLASDLREIIREASVLKWLQSAESGQQVANPRLAACGNAGPQPKRPQNLPGFELRVGRDYHQRFFSHNFPNPG
jgi:hypothetical protein